MSFSRRDSVRPVIVEVKPERRLSSYSPLTPPSPKAVRFAPSSGNAYSRPLSSVEAWSLYHFENHARHCASCFNPLEVTQRGGQLCDVGHGLAQDVAYHVYHREGEFYSTAKDYKSKLVRIEIPPGYNQLRSLLKSMDRALRSHRISSNIISYDRNYPIAPRRFDSQSERENVIIEPASSYSTSHHRQSKHKPIRYSTVVLNDDDDYSVKSPSSQRRGTLYDDDMKRKKENYRVEIREPRRREHEHPRRSGGVWL